MYSAGSSDISVPGSISRLLSESPLLESTSTGHGGDDLSISELSLSDRTALFEQKPFSLLARPHEASRVEAQDEDELRVDQEDPERPKRNAVRLREEKLQSDLFILKKINSTFAMFSDALDETGSANDRVSKQLEQTEGLLNKYISILTKSEQFVKLIFDEEWQGAQADEEILLREEQEAAEKARREAEERALAEQREMERLAREEKDKHDREEKERVEREKKERLASRGGIRGVRGTRASMRGMRAVATTSTRPSSTGTASTQSSSGGALKRPASSTGRVTTTRGIPRGRP
ncbi:hypothetical protein C8J56DRAFT_965096 [Mycena floridula]|nr:hypothetical protein C8J56DRAFT_965096 [Mycena floridula]